MDNPYCSCKPKRVRQGRDQELVEYDEKFTNMQNVLHDRCGPPQHGLS